MNAVLTDTLVNSHRFFFTSSSSSSFASSLFFFIATMSMCSQWQPPATWLEFSVNFILCSLVLSFHSSPAAVYSVQCTVCTPYTRREWWPIEAVEWESWKCVVLCVCVIIVVVPVVAERTYTACSLPQSVCVRVYEYALPCTFLIGINRTRNSCARPEQRDPGTNVHTYYSRTLFLETTRGYPY